MVIRAVDVRARDSWRETPVDSVVLDFDNRHRRRMAMTATRGFEFLLDLPKAVALRGGDALVLEDGRIVEVVAAPEPLVEIRAPDAAQLVRIAWHLGNRHLPAQLTGKALRIRRDHVIEDMVRGLGARVIEIEAPFDPEGGAYAEGGHGHAHDHSHGDHSHGDHLHDDHAHNDDHDHDQHAHHDHDGHSHDHAHHEHEHKHGHDHAHGHDHSDHGHAHGDSHAHKHKHGV